MMIKGMFVDFFAGGGGASEGIKRAIGRDPDFAVNHDMAAIKMHEANHPNTRHFCESVWEIDPIEMCGDAEVAGAWFSPDCKHHSRARGSKPVNKNIRGLAWVADKFAAKKRPTVMFIENVREFQEWGPVIAKLNSRGRPCRDKNGDVIMIPDPDKKGWTFKRWVGLLRAKGYVVEWKEMNAADYGAPTTRKRLFIIARCDGNPIVWPAATHAKPNKQGKVPPGMKPWRTAAECIDWSIPCHSIFLTKEEGRKVGVKRPLAENTLRRVANGLRRYVIDNAKPFIVRTGHYSNITGEGSRFRGQGLDQPVGTVTGVNDKAIVLPTMVKLNNGAARGDDRSHAVDAPMHTLVGKHGTALAAAYFARIGQTGSNGSNTKAVTDPLSTITSKAEHLVVSAHLTHFYSSNTNGGEGDPTKPMKTVTAAGKHHGLVAATLVKNSFNDKPCSGLDEPMHTVTTIHNKFSMVSAFLAKHYGGVTGHGVDRPIGTVTAKDHHSVVAPVLSRYYGQSVGSDVRDPLPTVASENKDAIVAANLIRYNTERSAGGANVHGMDEPIPTVVGENRIAQVQAFLVKFYKTANHGQSLDQPMDTITAKHRFGLVTIDNVDYQIVDIGIRMLQPKELFAAQGFPRDYKYDVGTKESQVARCGNSVVPIMAELLVKANMVVRKRKAVCA